MEKINNAELEEAYNEAAEFIEGIKDGFIYNEEDDTFTIKERDLELNKIESIDITRSINEDIINAQKNIIYTTVMIEDIYEIVNRFQEVISSPDSEKYTDNIETLKRIVIEYSNKLEDCLNQLDTETSMLRTMKKGLMELENGRFEL